MKRALMVAWAVGTVTLPVSLEAQRVKVVVFSFDDAGSYGKEKEEIEAMSRGVQAILISEMGKASNGEIVGRDEVRQAVQEENLRGKGRVNARVAARIASRLGAKYAVIGTFVDLYGDFRIDARVIDASSGQIISEVKGDPKLTSRDSLFRIIQSVAMRVAAAGNIRGTPEQERAARDRNVPVVALLAFGRGLGLFDEGDKDKAAEQFTLALKNHPDFAEAKEWLAKAQR